MDLILLSLQLTLYQQVLFLYGHSQGINAKTCPSLPGRAYRLSLSENALTGSKQGGPVFGPTFVGRFEDKPTLLLLETGNHIGNRTKLLTDFINRERKATTGIVDGIAVPHIRSMQARDLMIAVARSSAGYDFGALDGEPTHLFFVMAAPPYDDALYLRVFKSLMEKLQYESFREELMEATEPGELLHTIRAME